MPIFPPLVKIHPHFSNSLFPSNSFSFKVITFPPLFIPLKYPHYLCPHHGNYPYNYHYTKHYLFTTSLTTSLTHYNNKLNYHCPPTLNMHPYPLNSPSCKPFYHEIYTVFPHSQHVPLLVYMFPQPFFCTYHPSLPSCLQPTTTLTNQALSHRR